VKAEMIDTICILQWSCQWYPRGSSWWDQLRETCLQRGKEKQRAQRWKPFTFWLKWILDGQRESLLRLRWTGDEFGFIARILVLGTIIIFLCLKSGFKEI
jgi:hypothetical protein